MKLEENDLVLYYIQGKDSFLKSICRIDELNSLGGVVAEEVHSLSELKLVSPFDEFRSISIDRNNIRKNFGKMDIVSFLQRFPEYNV